MDVKKRWGKAKNETATDNSRAARAAANQQFVRETLARRQPRYAQAVERAAEAVAHDLVQLRPAARDAVVPEQAALAARVREALAAAA